MNSLEKTLLPSRRAVHDPGRQGSLRSDHGQVDLLLLGELEEALAVVDGEVDPGGDFVHAPVPWSHVDLFNVGILGELPDQGVFSAASADDEDFH